MPWVGAVLRSPARSNQIWHGSSQRIKISLYSSHAFIRYGHDSTPGGGRTDPAASAGDAAPGRVLRHRADRDPGPEPAARFAAPEVALRRRLARTVSRAALGLLPGSGRGRGHGIRRRAVVPHRTGRPDARGGPRAGRGRPGAAQPAPATSSQRRLARRPAIVAADELAAVLAEALGRRRSILAVLLRSVAGRSAARHRVTGATRRRHASVAARGAAGTRRPAFARA